MAITIRTAAPEDAAAIVDVLQAVASERVHSAIVHPWTVARQRRYLEGLSAREVFHLAVDGPSGLVAGYQSLDLYSPFLESMAHAGQLGTFLHPNWRRKGIGQALFRASLDFAKRAAYSKFVIQVRGSNHGAQSFYRSLGFYPCGRLKAQVLIDGESDDEILMEFFLP